MNRLRELRLEKGLLQSDIAKIVGKKDRIIGFYETGERDPSTETVIKLAEFFNVSTDYLLGKSDIRNEKHSEIPEIRQIERGAIKMSQKDREKMVNMIKAAFEEAFNEDSEN